MKIERDSLYALTRTILTGKNDTPERKLHLAQLIDAIECYNKTAAEFSFTANKQARKREQNTEAIKAERWFKAVDYKSPFSFENVCNVLGLESDYIRRLLLDETRDLQKEETYESAENYASRDESVQSEAKRAA